MQKVKWVLKLQVLLLVMVHQVKAQTRVTPSSYIVSNIEVASREEDRSKAEQDLFLQAKEKALSFVKLYLNKETVDTKSVDIDSLMIEFSPIEIKRQAGLGIVGMFEVVFDKSSIDSLLAVSKITSVTERGIPFRIIMRNGPIDWLILKRYFFKNNINYKITLFGADFVQGEVLKMSQEEMMAKLNPGGFEVVKNNSLYFIKSIS